MDDPKTQLRFSQLSAKEMAMADMNDTPRAEEPRNREARLVADTFDDFDQHTLVALAHVEHQPCAGTT